MSSNSKIVINKFGGVIMGSAELINLAVDIIQKQIKSGLKPINVVSACSGITDKLELVIEEALKGNAKYKGQVLNDFLKSITRRHLKLAEKLLAQGDQRLETDILREINGLKDHLNTLSQFGGVEVVFGSLMAYGERLSSLIFAAVLKQQGIKTKRYTAENVGIITNDDYLDADIIFKESKSKSKKNIRVKPMPVVCGFCGKTKTRHTAVLGRGGSDTTACFLGNILKADKIYLWKTVDGVLSADPRIVKDAKTVQCLTYIEAEESGKVICDKAMQYAHMAGIPVIVANINKPQNYTTVNCQDHSKRVKMVIYKKDQVLFEIHSGHMAEYGFLHKITEIFSQHELNMNLIRNTRDAFYIVTNNHSLNVKKIVDDLLQLGHYLKIKPCAMVSIIGTLGWDLTHKFNVLLKETAKTVRLGAFPYKGCTRLEAIVESKEMDKLIRKLHNTFIK